MASGVPVKTVIAKIPTARRVSPKGLVTHHGARVANVWLCQPRLSALAVGSYKNWRSVLSACVTNLEPFKIVCLDKDVLYTALVTMHTV